MNSKTFSLLSSLIVALSLPLAQAGVPKANETVSMSELAAESKAQTALKQVQNAAASNEFEADQFKSAAAAGLSAGSDLDSLTALRWQVNEMGKRIAALNDERDALNPIEQQALDTLLPLAQSVAANTTGAIAYFNENRDLRGTAPYRAFANNIYQNAKKIKATLDDSFKYEKLRAQEAKLQDREQSESE